MKSLLTYILEAFNPESAREFIMNSIDFLSDDEIIGIAEKIEKMNAGKNIEEYIKILDEQLNERFDSRKLKLGKKEIISILGRNKDLVALIEFYKTGGVDINDIISANNIVERIKERVGISEKSINEIYNISGGSRPSIGRGEILLGLICNNIDKKGQGDVVFKDHQNFELKDWGGAILYENMWKDPDLEKLWNAFWGDQKTKKGLKRLSVKKTPESQEFIDLLEDITGIKNYKDLNKVWSAYLILKYSEDHYFTDLLVGNYLIPGDYFRISSSRNVKDIYETIKNMPIAIDWPSIPGATGGSIRCAIKYQK